MNYSEQLQQEEWKQKRYEILERDHFECQVCHVKRSDFLGLSFEFGIVNYTDFLILGYIVKRTGKNSESIEITKNGNKINCINLVDSISQVGLENLFFAQKWRERKNKLVFPALDLLCFLKGSLDETKYFDLNVHHKYYKIGKMAWEYDHDAFITLCVSCHKLEHETNVISVLDERNNALKSTIICDRCNGRGVLPEYKYYYHGICFKCNGLGNLLDSDFSD